MPGKNDNTSENLGPYEDEKSILEEQDIKRENRDSSKKNSDTRNCITDKLSRHTLQDRIFASDLSSFLNDVRFHEQEFPVDKSVLEIKYHHLSSQNNNLFYLFNNQLDYTLINYIGKSETIKDN